MQIEFDPEKRDKTLLERGLDMAACAAAFDGPCLTFPDMRRGYGEDRFISFALLDGRMVVIVWTPRGKARRVISLRKANDREIREHAKRLD
jgi:uncharacterized protein